MRQLEVDKEEGGKKADVPRTPHPHTYAQLMDVPLEKCIRDPSCACSRIEVTIANLKVGR